MRRRSLTLALLSSLALVPLACGGDDTGQTPQALCDQETRADEYVAGLERASEDGMFMARLVEGTPAPPDRGNNTWMIEILDPNGTPMADVTSVRVRAWMPDHGHGTNPEWNPATATADGKFEVGPFNLFMPGFWQFTVWAEAQNQTDTAIVSFCIEG